VTPAATLLLCGAAGCAGFVDAVAGGGGLITVPALLSFVPSPHLALGTNKGQAVFGAISSAASFWRGKGVDEGRAPLAFACGGAGAVAGALLQLRVRPEPLKPVALVLLVVAAAVVMLRPLIVRGAVQHTMSFPRARLAAIASLIGCYDGFFGPGTGTLLIVAFVVFHGDAMTRASGNAKVVNLASNLASFAIFAAKGTIVWEVALPMAVCNAIGSAAGARTAMKHGDAFVRVVVLVVVVALVAKLAFDLLR
jgi:uncharacterized membrane protein YfcA